MTTVTGRPARKARATPGRPARPSAQDRFAQRVSAKRRRMGKLLGTLLLLAVLGAGAWWALWRSDWLLVEKVVVTGTEARWHQPVLAAAAVDLAQPMVQVDTSAAAAAVAELSIVREVDVVRSWPATITVKVTSREPVLGVRQGPDRVALVDDEGVTIETVAQVPDDVPLVVASGSSGATAEAYRAAWAVLSTLPPALSAQVGAVTISSAELVTLELGARTVVWGGPQEGALKAEVAEALLATDAEVIDVSAPRSPVTRGTVQPPVTE